MIGNMVRRWLRQACPYAFFILAVLALSLLGCSSEDEPFTWGDALAELAAASCSAVIACDPSVDRDACLEAQVSAGCESGACETELAAGASGAVETCVDSLLALPESFCPELLAGQLPAACDEARSFKP